MITADICIPLIFAHKIKGILEELSASRMINFS